MFPCITVYSVALAGDHTMVSGEAVYREWRHPDGFGDPGALVRRQLLEYRIDGQVFTESNPVIRGRRMQKVSETIQRQPIWESVLDDGLV